MMLDKRIMPVVEIDWWLHDYDRNTESVIEERGVILVPMLFNSS